MSNYAVKISDLWKRYQIGQVKSTSFRENFGQWFKRREVEYFWALREIDFEVKKGEAVGIIGKNGAGKSTLLKVLSKITYPTKGRIEIDGRISSLLEVGTGFHPELTGRQNVFLNGSILGMTKKEIQSKFDEIITFSGVEKFIDTPVKHYSSGMKVRLAFSVAAHLEPEILIIDEVLAVGDAEFQKKCLGKMEDVTGEGRTVLFVSHNLIAVSKLCSKGILLENGQLSEYGDVNDVLGSYTGIEEVKPDSLRHEFEISDSSKFAFRSIELKPENSSAKIITGKPLTFHLNYQIQDKSHVFNDCHISLEIRDRNEQVALHLTTSLGIFPISDKELKKEKSLTLRIEEMALKPGNYSLGVNCVQSNEFLNLHQNFMIFEVEESVDLEYASNQHSGMWIPKARWNWIN